MAERVADGGISVEQVYIFDQAQVPAADPRHLNEGLGAVIRIGVHTPGKPQLIAGQSGTGNPRIRPIQPAATVGRA
jgi:hypothetical protein